MIDTHCHLGLCEAPAAALVADANAVGVRRLLSVGIDEDAGAEAIATAERHEQVLAAVGHHPNGAGGFDDDAAARLERLAAHPRVAAVGETGARLLPRPRPARRPAPRLPGPDRDRPPGGEAAGDPRPRRRPDDRR